MKKFRIYYDKDLELEWLNKMCQKGYVLTNFKLGMYTFEPCEPGEYNYQIDLLDNETHTYEEVRNAMKGKGVEVVAHWYQWLFMRKKAADGPFEMYEDIADVKKQYERIKKMYTNIFFVEGICCFVELMAFMNTGNLFFFIFLIVLICLTGSMLHGIYKCSKKLKSFV